MHTRLVPLAREHHHGTAHSRNASRVGDSLAAEFLVAFLVVANVVQIVSLRLAILSTLENATDVRLAHRARTEACRVREESLEELDRNNVLTLELDRLRAEHAHVFEATHVVEVALAKRHEEADALDARNVLGQGFNFFVVEEVHVLLADLCEVVFTLDAHGRDFNPVALAVLVRVPVAARSRNFAEVDFRVEVRCELVTVIAAVAVENVDFFDRVELVLQGVGAVCLRNTRVKAGTEQSRETSLFKLFFVSPLPAVIEVGAKALFLAALVVDLAPFRIVDIFRLVVSRVHVVHATFKACIHDGEVLVGESDIHHQVRLVLLNESRDVLGLVSVHGGSRDDRLRIRAEFLSQLLAIFAMTAGDADFAKNFAAGAALLDSNCGNGATTDNQCSCHFLFVPHLLRVNPSGWRSR